MSFWSDLILAVESALGGESNAENTAGPATATVPSIPGLGAFVTLVEGIWTELTDGRMWRSLGWLLLGIILMLLGAAWWIGPSSARRSPAGIVAERLG